MLTIAGANSKGRCCEKTVEPRFIPRWRMNQLKTNRYITDNDLSQTCTLNMLGDLELVLRELEGRITSAKKLLDVGCGFGGLGMTLGDRLGIHEVHGMDIDSAAITEASAKGMLVCYWDIGKYPYPYPADHFDLVVSFGVLDRLPWFDDALREVYRMLRAGGYTIISLPNLAGWHNRLLLALGYQPRDIEVSKEMLAGVHPYYYRDDYPTGHIHTVTTSAFTDLMEHFGFCTVCVRSGQPLYMQKSFLMRTLDLLMSKSPRMARRFFYVGQKPFA